MIGATISHYRITEKLGEGGMGVVYKAEDCKLHRYVALKFLSPELTQNEKANERFIYEAQTASGLDHQNISTIYEIDNSDDGRMFISMAFYGGDTLQNRISKGNINISEAVNIAIQIAEGLTKAHQKGIIHKDIKPANIIISEENTVKIIDFGLSILKKSSQPKQLQNKMGTIPYMSPEVIKGKNIDFRTDIWSLGVVLYEMITGKLPFEGEYDQEIIYSILVEELIAITELVPDIPKELERILFKVLQKKQEKRYKTMQALQNALKKVNNYFYINSDPHYLSQQKETSIEALAVLPLENLSGDPEQEYFTEGMTDVLITTLAKLLSIKVISRKSTMPYRKTDKSLPEIAEELNVDAIVEGSVLREGKRIQITIQLIRAVTDTHLWAEKYERKLEDVLILQEEVVKAIAKEINATLSKYSERRFSSVKPINPDQYDNYLRGCFHFYKLSPEHFDKAYEYYSEALKKDGNYALAYAGIAQVWFGRSYWGIISHHECMQKAKEAVKKALELDDSLEEAHDVFAKLEYYYDWDWNTAENGFKKAIAINPNYADAHLFYSALLRSMKRDEEAFNEVKIGLELDPINFFSQCFFVGHLLHTCQFDDAIRKLRDILKTEPNFSMAHRYLWVAYHKKKVYDKALESAIHYFSALRKNEIADLLSLNYSELGYHSVMNLAAANMEEYSNETFIQPLWIARLYAYADNTEQACIWLRNAYRERDPLLVNIGVSRDWDNLREINDFENLLTELNSKFYKKSY